MRRLRGLLAGYHLAFTIGAALILAAIVFAVTLLRLRGRAVVDAQVPMLHGEAPVSVEQAA